METKLILHKLNSLRYRVEAFNSTSGHLAPFNDEVRSIFDRYNSLREQLANLSSEYFSELVNREPLLDEEGWVYSTSVKILQLDIVEIERGLELLEYSNRDEQRETEVRFWSYRNNIVGSKDWLKSTVPAVLAMIKRLSGACFFAEQFGETCQHCTRLFGFAEWRINQILAEQLPGLLYPPTNITQDQLFDLIEFLNRFVSEPLEFTPCGWDDDECPSRFSAKGGREKYTKEINMILERFAAPFRFSQGQIVRVGSQVIEELLQEPIITPDAELNRLISSAIAAFRDKVDRRVQAAEVCCKAFEHMKHRYGKDTRSGSQNLIKKLVENDDQFEKFNAYWLALTNLGHTSLRHSKPGSPSTNDALLSEYLFIQYYSAIYFVHKQTAESEISIQNITSPHKIY